MRPEPPNRAARGKTPRRSRLPRTVRSDPRDTVRRLRAGAHLGGGPQREQTRAWSSPEMGPGARRVPARAPAGIRCRMVRKLRCATDMGHSCRMQRACKLHRSDDRANCGRSRERASCVAGVHTATPAPDARQPPRRTRRTRRCETRRGVPGGQHEAPGSPREPGALGAAAGRRRYLTSIRRRVAVASPALSRQR